MAVERKFINEAMQKVRVSRYIRNELNRVGCGDIDVKRTPLGTRILISAIKPGLVIGRKGKNIQMLTETLKNEYKIENPQLEVQEVNVPELDPSIMSKQLAATLEKGIHFRRAAGSLVRQIMSKGALGVQVEINGKISGSRARNEKFKQGYIKHCGETALQYVKEDTAHAILKAGKIGIKVKITPPRERAFNELSLEKIKELAEVIAEKVQEPATEEVKEAPTVEAQKEKKSTKKKEDKESKPEKKAPKAKKKTVKKKEDKESKSPKEKPTKPTVGEDKK